MEWSKEETILLIDIYKSKYLLWDSKHSAYLKKYFKRMHEGK